MALLDDEDDPDPLDLLPTRYYDEDGNLVFKRTDVDEAFD